jgi:3',5'-cyclic AMP phosphodiesterase CpdA
MARVVVVSDTHLSPHVPSADRQWDAVLAELEQRPPELLVHAGDLSVRGASDPADLTYARRRLDESPVPWRAIAGNHDIGDIGATEEPVNDERRARYAELVGASSWAVDLAGWHLVGVDVQTLASDLPAAGELWVWLADALAVPGPTVLFSHRPLRPPPGRAADDPGRYLTGDVRARVTALLDEHDVRSVVSGHVHQWMLLTGTRQHVWAPSAWASIPEPVQPTIGEKVTGIVELELLAAAAEPVVRLLRPPGLGDLVIGVDFPSPY